MHGCEPLAILIDVHSQWLAGCRVSFNLMIHIVFVQGLRQMISIVRLGIRLFVIWIVGGTNSTQLIDRIGISMLE
jgi:hypothetical protein